MVKTPGLSDGLTIQPGAYFVTLVALPTAPPLARIQGEQTLLTVWGEAIRAAWFHTTDLRPYVRLDPVELVIMPNHLHGILWIVGHARPEARASMASIIHGFKRTTTRRFQVMQGDMALRLWQDDLIEHYIRDAFVLHAVRNYIQLNPSHWPQDCCNPLHRGEDDLSQALWAIFRASYDPPAR